MINRFFYIVLLASLMHVTILPTWINNGTMDLSNSSMNIPEFENNGDLILKVASDLKFKQLRGNGLIKIESGKHKLEAIEFLFTGVIECEGELDIYTSTSTFDIKFVKKGNGKININPLINSKL